MLWNHHHHQAAAKRGSLGSKTLREWHNVSAVSSLCATYGSNLPICEHSHHSYVCYRQCSVSKCIGIQHVVVAPGALITGHMANPHPFLPHHSRPGVGPTNESVFQFVVLPQSTGNNLR